MEISWETPLHNPATGKLITNPATGKLITLLNDSIKVYYLNDMILYKVGYQFTQYNKNAIKNNKLIMTDDPKTIDIDTIRYEYYLHKLGSNIGLKFDSISGLKFTKFHVDSLLKSKGYLDYHDFSYDTNDSLIKSSKTPDKLIQEKYVTKIKVDESYPDTSYYIFDPKFKTAFPYTLSKKLDSLRKMKLVEIRFTYNPYIKEYNGKSIEMERKAFVFKIKEKTIGNKAEILRLFEKFNQDWTN